MKVIINQHLWLDNVISYRTRIEFNKLSRLINHISINIEALDLKITGDMVFSITETITDNDFTILGVEFIIPVNQSVTSNSHFVFKPKFRLENAVMLKYCGKISEICTVKRLLNEYALDHNMSVLTDVYYELKQLDGDNTVINAYMGLCGNSL